MARTPEPALHSDRRADAASGAAAGEECGDRVGRALESLDAGGASRVMYLHDDTGACDVESRPDRDFDAGDAPAADEGCLTIRREAEDGRHIAAEELPHLGCNGRERLAGEAPCATSVATRRNAACSSPLRRRSVTSRPAAQANPSAGTARAVHWSHRREPSEQI